MKYIVDIDGTICRAHQLPSGKWDYANHTPIDGRITRINKLYEEGHTIKYMTARGAVSGIDYYEMTKNQLDSWGCKYHELSVGEKEDYDIWVDDKAHNSEVFFK